MGFLPVALEGKGSNGFSITLIVGKKKQFKVSKCKLKKYLFGSKLKEKAKLDCLNFDLKAFLLLDSSVKQCEAFI